MSMRREEAIEILSDWNLCHHNPSKEAAEAVISAFDPLEIISALRGPTREMVERVWLKEPYTRLETWNREDGATVYSQKTPVWPAGVKLQSGIFATTAVQR